VTEFCEDLIVDLLFFLCYNIKLKLCMECIYTSALGKGSSSSGHNEKPSSHRNILLLSDWEEVLLQKYFELLIRFGEYTYDNQGKDENHNCNDNVDDRGPETG
jgi:hypothetical protein